MVSVHGFSAASDRRSGQFDRKRDSSVAESHTRVQRSRLGTRTKLKTRSPRKKCWFCHIIAKYHVPDPPASPVMYGTGISQEVGNGGQVCGDVETVGFPVQNVYKMTYGDKNPTFEPLVCDSATLESLFRSNWPHRRSEAALNL